MYELLKGIALKILKVPPEPEAPEGTSLQVFRAAPSFYKYRLYLWIFRQVLVLLIMGGFVLAMGAGALASFGEGEPAPAVLLGVGAVCLAILLVVLALFSYTTLRMDYEMRWYKVTDRSLRIREGVVHVREMTMTFANIQNISISQGPVQRYFKIADLKVETAGGGGGAHGGAQQGQEHAFNMHIGFFRGVDNAQEIRDLMLERLRKLKSAGLGDDDDHNDETEEAEAVDSDELDVLRAILDEARLMRQSAQRR